MSWADLVVGAIELAVNVGAEVADRSDRTARALEAADAGEQALQAQREADDQATSSGLFEQPQFVPGVAEDRFENPDFIGTSEENSDSEPLDGRASPTSGQAQLR